jgi:hypothetical protein
MGKKSQSTKLAELPDESDIEVDSKELSILNNILNVNKKSPQEYQTLKFVLYATGIFALLSLPFTDRILELAVPMTNSWLILVGLKTVLFFVFFYIVFYLNR